MSKRPSIGVGVIVRKGDQVLLLKRQNAHGDGTWSMPGGHLEYGEAPQDCALRETLEETGVMITDVAFRTITNDIFEEEGKHYVTLWMEARYASGEARVNSAREMSAVGWFSWDALPAPLFLPFENLLAQGYEFVRDEQCAYAGCEVTTLVGSGSYHNLCQPLPCSP
jgi:8-oxo-dGTP diphosphatase